MILKKEKKKEENTEGVAGALICTVSLVKNVLDLTVVVYIFIYGKHS